MAIVNGTKRVRVGVNEIAIDWSIQVGANGSYLCIDDVRAATPAIAASLPEAMALSVMDEVADHYGVRRCNII